MSPVFIELTRQDGLPLTINVAQIGYVIKSNDNGGVVYIWWNGEKQFPVKENYEDVLHAIEVATSKNIIKVADLKSNE